MDIERKKHIELRHFDLLQKQEWINNYQKIGMLEYEKAGIEYILDKQNVDNISDTEYNAVFSNCDGIYSHGIKKYKELIYRLSAEIAYEMYRSGNTKLFLSKQEIENIVNNLNIGDVKIKEIVQHCYALCNYWRSNGKGVVEFYHNNIRNIRDFFLREKIFYEFNDIYCKCKQLDIREMIKFFNERMCDLFKYMEIPAKVVEFIYLRTKYKHKHYDMEDFLAKECEDKYLRQFFLICFSIEV